MKSRYGVADLTGTPSQGAENIGIETGGVSYFAASTTGY